MNIKRLAKLQASSGSVVTVDHSVTMDQRTVFVRKVDVGYDTGKFGVDVLDMPQVDAASVYGVFDVLWFKLHLLAAVGGKFSGHFDVKDVASFHAPKRLAHDT